MFLVGVRTTCINCCTRWLRRREIITTIKNARAHLDYVDEGTAHPAGRRTAVPSRTRQQNDRSLQPTFGFKLCNCNAHGVRVFLGWDKGSPTESFVACNFRQPPADLTVGLLGGTLFMRIWECWIAVCSVDVIKEQLSYLNNIHNVVGGDTTWARDNSSTGILCRRPNKIRLQFDVYALLRTVSKCYTHTHTHNNTAWQYLTRVERKRE